MVDKNMVIIKCLPREFHKFDECGMMKFWCPFCEKWHLHGKGEGHRCSHCIDDSPYKDSGYKIKMMSLKELKEIRKEIDDYLKCYKKVKTFNK